ncbi:transglycosylase domain-containing protein [Taklimakanibacter deserti]|uniref:transglycosylase domain-containing protein n=1 Tax=Taklimakanibacter deserti TaxID=2267839 RepID=UPI000E65D475
MAKSPKKSNYLRMMWLDSYVSSAVYEVFDWLRRSISAYSSFVYRFRLSGPKRVIVDLLDDMATFGTVACLGLLAFALPPFSGTGDVWNKGRDYAITFTDENGEIIGRRGIRQDDAIPLEDIPPHVVKAVLATEDARFYQHFGVDVLGTFRAIIQNARANDVVQGGSSITQQVAKNLFLSPERTIQRKVHEAFLSLWIEARLSKDEILKLYLDRSYLGGGNYGVEAAAQYYFGKSIRDVNLAEASMLAGLFKAPSKYAPHVSMAQARARANVVLYRMLDSGFITQGQLVQARREPALLVNSPAVASPDWFLDKAYADTLALIEAKHITGDYVIEVKTTINAKLQEAAQSIIDKSLDTEGPQYHATQAAVVTMATDGAVKAIVGGRDYENSQFNRATDAMRQPGSSFKPFVYLAALLNGYTPDSVVLDGPVSVGGWAPRNYTGKYGGRVSLTTALAKSYNSVPVRLSQDFGRPAIIETARKVGLKAELETWPPMVLGTSAMTLFDITTAYGTFATGGVVLKPYTVLEIRRPNGDVIYNRANEPPEERVQAVPEEKVAELNHMMNAVVEAGTGRRAFLGFTPQAGKTGTNQSYRDAWFIGYTAHYVTGVWFGNDDFTPMNKVTGGLLPAGAWHDVMLWAEQPQVGAALPGIPLEEKYAQYALENPAAPLEDVPDMSADDQIADADAETPADQTAAVEPDDSKPETTKSAAITPPTKTAKPRRQRVAPQPTEEDVAIVRTRESDDPVVSVLKDMFSIFSNDDDSGKKAKRKRKDTVLVLPDANTKKKRKSSNVKFMKLKPRDR